MSGDWLPVLVVLGVGALAGIAVAWRLGRSSSQGRPDLPAGDEALRLDDLHRRRDDLYARLRRSDNEADRRVLEKQAARVLRDIDELGSEGAVGKRATRELAGTEPGGDDSTTPPTHAQAPGRPMFVGFIGGAAMVALVALLIYFALGDAQPDQQQPGMAPMRPAGGEDHPSPQLPPEVVAQLEDLRAQIAADPNNMLARKQLALALLASEQFFEAFEVSNQILAARADDPDGLYVQGMVRMTMGQDEMALGNLDRVLEQYPNHLLALAGRGMIFMRQGDREAAILVWERALAAAGGSHPDLEQLLAIARDPSSGMASAARPQAPVEPVEPVQQQAVAGDGFRVRIELAPGASVPAGATLFLFLRDTAQGPPAAVKRLHDPVFPMDVVLGSADSMLGRPLPTAGTISARLDADGSASTRGDGDLMVEIAARLGDSVRLVLGE